MKIKSRWLDSRFLVIEKHMKHGIANIFGLWKVYHRGDYYYQCDRYPMRFSTVAEAKTFARNIGG